MASQEDERPERGTQGVEQTKRLPTENCTPPPHHVNGQGEANGADHTYSDERMRHVAQMAFALRAAGLHPYPAKENGEKRPEGTWKRYQKEMPSELEIKHLYARGRYSVGVITGVTTGRTIETPDGPAPLKSEVLDFDRWDPFIEYGDLAQQAGLGSLFERVKQGWSEQTPRPGAHLWWLCVEAKENQKLALDYQHDEHGQVLLDEHGKPKTKATIETRGIGGYCLCYPSFGPVHETGRPYQCLSGGPATIAIITPEERHDLLNLARAFNKFEDTKNNEKQREEAHTSSGDRPGDIFNARGTWEEALPSGWVLVYTHNGTGAWRRPGKERGISATTNHAGSDLFYCFSTSTAFASERGYNKFGVYALSHHNGDFGAAALALAEKGYTNNSAGASQAFDMGNDEEDDEQETEEEENARMMKEERPIEDKWPCPTHLWRGPFALVAEATGKQTWEVWTATLVALGAKAHRNIAYKYHRMLYGMVYALLIKGTGMGKGLSTDLCRGLMTNDYVIRDAVQSGPALAPLLADIVRGQKGKVESCTPHPALLLIEEFTVLLKNAGIQHSTLIDSLNSLFHRPWSWNISRSERPNSGGGDVVIKDPTLSILATTTHALFKEYVSPQMIRSGFLNRFLVLPGDSTPWKFYDPEGAGKIIAQNLGLFDHIRHRKVGEGKTVWDAYTPEACERIKSWGEETFEPIMQSSELEAESVKRLHVYAHVIGLLYSWGDQRPLVNLDDVECSITAIGTGQQFLQALITEDREPEVPKFKAYEINLEQRILAKVRAEAKRGIRRRKVVQGLAGRTATSPDINLLISKMVMAEALIEAQEHRERPGPLPHKLFLPEHAPKRKKPRGKSEG